MDLDKILAMNDYRSKKSKSRNQIDDVLYDIKVTNSTITIRSKHDSFSFEYNFKVRFMNVHEGIEKYCHERMMKKRSLYQRNPLSSQRHRNKLIQLVKSYL